MTQIQFLDLAPHNKTETSIAAAESIQPLRARHATRILEYIKSRQPSGSTCAEAEDFLQMSHQSVSARIRDLFKLGFIKDSGLRRETKSGRKAIVWVAGCKTGLCNVKATKF